MKYTWILLLLWVVACEPARKAPEGIRSERFIWESNDSSITMDLLETETFYLTINIYTPNKEELVVDEKTGESYYTSATVAIPTYTGWWEQTDSFYILTLNKQDTTLSGGRIWTDIKFPAQCESDTTYFKKNNQLWIRRDIDAIPITDMCLPVKRQPKPKIRIIPR